MTGFAKLKAMFGKDRSKADPQEVETEPCHDNPPELGQVRFLRDLEIAYQLSAETKKPIFLLFQEIPGCSTCTNFGTNVLQPESMVRAITQAFIPVAINNRCLIGHDKKACASFKEPLLNNPVVRFIDANGKDLIPRKGGVYTATEMTTRMKQALKKANRSDLITFLP